MIQDEGDADVKIAKTVVTMSAFKSTTLAGEDTDLLVFLICHIGQQIALYSTSARIRQNRMPMISKSLSKYSEKRLAMIYCFSTPLPDATQRPKYYLGSERSQGSEEIIKRGKRIRDFSKAFCSPKDVVETNGSMAMVALFNGNQNESLASVRYNILCKKVARNKTFVTLERLPPTTSACKFHSPSTYYQIME